MQLSDTYETDCDWVEYSIEGDFQAGEARTYYSPGYECFYEPYAVHVDKCEVRVPFLFLFRRTRSLSQLSEAQLERLESRLLRRLEDNPDLVSDLLAERLEELADADAAAQESAYESLRDTL